MVFTPKFKQKFSFTKKPLAVAVLALMPAVAAQAQIEEVMVTAQKREQSLQDVPISLQSFNTDTIAELGIQDFQDYARMMPSVQFQPTPATGVGFTQVYMRGVTTGRDGQATTSQPSVGMYLDEQPITTIQGNLDIHMYDIARVEALAGPQGTLYGASSQSGTIRIITNKPDPSAFAAGYAVDGNVVDGDDTGYTFEGFVNMPLSDSAALRVVAWNRRDGGWIDNARGTRTFPGLASTDVDDIVLDNADVAEDNYNTVDTIGARAALLIDLDEDWTITPQLQYQKQQGEGSWGEDLSDFGGDQQVTHFKEEFTDDEWFQAALTVEGKISNFDLVYAGAYLDREVDGSFDYSDYSYWYDTIYTTGYYADLHFLNSGDRSAPNQFFDDAGTRIMPGARFVNDDGYEKTSHEVRISSPQDADVRFQLGAFYQKQEHDFHQRWLVEGLAPSMWPNQGADGRFRDIVYLNSLYRTDEDQAFFGSVSFDINDDLEATVGARYFKPEVSVEGFYGFGLGFNGVWSGTGEVQCETQDDWNGKPCKNVDKNISETDQVYRANLTYRVNDDVMVYGTWSEGYRPGGINRKPDAGEYVSDFLTNYEFGWKTTLVDGTLLFNGAVFLQEWDDFQVSFVGANAITQVDNGPTADINGIESQIQWLPSAGLEISAAFTYLDSELQSPYCDLCESDGGAWAPAGTSLPLAAEFKGNMVARYSFEWAGFDAHMQGSVAYEGERNSDLRLRDNVIKGTIPSNTFMDISAGLRNDSYAVEVYVSNLTDEDAPLYYTSQCATGTCGSQNYGVLARPRTIGLRFSQSF
ncbi:MAG: TonB-dependent receptor [Proteobacteria bacterium]|nr:TonB-dependent receptor [Pseudomonadota bacterium]